MATLARIWDTERLERAREHICNEGIGGCSNFDADDCLALISSHEAIRVDYDARIAELEGDRNALRRQLDDAVQVIHDLSAKREMLEAERDRLRDKLTEARRLLQDVLESHADPDSSDYNECDTDPCQWCEDARKAMEEKGE